jgi:hypothetical protein
MELTRNLIILLDVSLLHARFINLLCFLMFLPWFPSHQLAGATCLPARQWEGFSLFLFFCVASNF